MATKKPTPNKKWAQGIDLEKGSLHKALGIDQSKKIGSTLINKIVSTDIGETISTPGGKKKVTAKMKQKANFVKNINK
jgi:hypothetical protein